MGMPGMVEHKDEDDARPFSPSERQELRQIIEADKRMRWLYSSLRIWGAWTAAVIGFLYLVKDWIKGAINGGIH